MKKILIVFILFYINSFATIYELKNKKSTNFNNDAIKTIKQLLKKPISNNHILNKNIKNYYKYNNYQALWVYKNGIKDISLQLIYKISEDKLLHKDANKLFNINKALRLYDEASYNSVYKMRNLIKLDILLTTMYHQYMSYLAKGIINWDDLKKELEKLANEKEIIAAWEQYGTRKSYRKLLYKSLKIDDLSISFNAVDITFPKARKLMEAISFHEEILRKGDFIKIPETKSLMLGDKSVFVKLLRNRLEQSQEIAKKTCPKYSYCLDEYDLDMKKAVKAFQKNHGLKADGIVGKYTRKALNVSAKEKIKTIKLNLERMRWLPRTLGKKYILVNIPEYKLKVYDDNKIKFNTKIVVGKKTHPTPVFSNKMSYIVLNPYWRIPERIVKKEIIPELIKNPNYLDGQGIRIHESWEENSNHFDLKSIDWTYYAQKENKEDNLKIPVKFIQKPSDKNPLGKVKFMFPNKYSVYLHDTPSKDYFNLRKRAYSHGCIRVNNPQELLRNIAHNDENIDLNKAQEVLSDIQKEKIDLEKKLPVHIIYLTSWVNEDNKVQFREDIYGYDEMQYKIIEKTNKLL